MNDIVNLNSMIDFTLLDARASLKDIEKLCEIAYKNQYYSVCVNSCNVAYAKGYISKYLPSQIKVVSVIGFPLGANSTEAKLAEAKQALIDGADELDVVVNIGRLKDDDFDYIKQELKAIKRLAKRKIVKVIIETCYLDKNEIIKVCKACIDSKVDFVKTSTGFGTGGANTGDVTFISKLVLGKCKVKASGGIRSREQSIELINSGASRIGTSHIL